MAQAANGLAGGTGWRRRRRLKSLRRRYILAWKRKGLRRRSIRRRRFLQAALMAGALAWAVQAFYGRLEWKLENPFWDKRDIFEKERLEALELPGREQGTKEGIHILFDRGQVIFFRVREEGFSD